MAELDKINVNGELYDMSDSKARSDIASEITNRTNAYKALDDKVKAETEARTSADNALNQKIVQETTDRTNADNALQEKINTNKTGIDNLVNDVAIRNVKAEEVTNVPEVKLPLDEVKEEIEAAGNRVLNSIPDDYTQINNKISELKSDLDEVKTNPSITPKFVKIGNGYITNAQTGIVDDGNYILYQLTNFEKEHILYFYDNNSGSTASYQFCKRIWLQMNDDSFVALMNTTYSIRNGNNDISAYIETNVKRVLFWDVVGVQNVYRITDLCSLKYEDDKLSTYSKSRYVNKPYNAFENAIYYKTYFSSGGKYSITTNSFYLWIPLKSGETISLDNLERPESYFNAEVVTNIVYGNTITATVSVLANTVKSYTATDDCIVVINAISSTSNVATVYPKDYFSYLQNKYNGLNGVAFGTSLTYRSQTTGGYLQFLPSLSGITFDNQGVGSSKIYGNAETSILNKILNYTDYADKNVVLIEGFVNDWYNNSPLGDIYDTGTETVCGCLYNAIHHILTKNNNSTIIVILDHFGINAHNVDMSASVSKNVGKQLDYYEKLSKVCMLYGIPCIKEYEIANMNQDTSKYYLDYIHMNALGAEQSANAIWSKMKQIIPSI